MKEARKIPIFPSLSSSAPCTRVALLVLLLLPRKTTTSFLLPTSRPINHSPIDPFRFRVSRGNGGVSLRPPYRRPPPGGARVLLTPLHFHPDTLATNVRQNVRLRLPLSQERQLQPQQQPPSFRQPAKVACRATSSSSSSSTTTETSGQLHFAWTRETIAIALPALIGMLADPLLSLMDTAYVGRVGSLELAALGACTSIFHLAFNAFRATTAATTSLVASRLEALPAKATSIKKNGGDGDSKNDDAHDAARQVIWISLQLGAVLGCLVTTVLVVFGNRALASMGIASTSPLYAPAAAYLFTRCWAAPVVLTMVVAEGAFRGYSNTIVPLMASLVAAGINLVLDPVLMFAKPFQMGVAGAAAATALSQVGAAAVYLHQLIRCNMLPRGMFFSLFRREGRQQRDQGKLPATAPRAAGVVRAILGANLSMLIKQGSLLFGWAFATARATRLSAEHVAAHQVALSVWLVFALILDGAAVAAQVLMSRSYAHIECILRWRSTKKVRQQVEKEMTMLDGMDDTTVPLGQELAALPIISPDEDSTASRTPSVIDMDDNRVESLTRYMMLVALLQGLISMLIVDGIDWIIPSMFTPDPAVQAHLHQVMPVLALQQVLVSLTLVMESLAAGANQFTLLAVGTTASALAALWQLNRQTSVEGIWMWGIGTLFVGRCATAVVALGRAFWRLRWLRKQKKNDQNKETVEKR